MYTIRASRRLPKLVLLLTVAATAIVFLAPSAEADSGLTLVTNTPSDLSTVSPGDTISYSFTATNIGPDEATSVVLGDSPAGDTTYVTDSARIDGADVPGDETPGDPNPFVAGVPLGVPLALNASVTFSFTAVVNSPLPDGTQLVNTASAVDTDDGDPPTTSQITQTVNSTPGLSVAKTSDPLEEGTVEPDDVISYSVVVASVGTDTATAVTVTDPTPTGTEYVPNSAKLDGVDLNAATNPFEGGFLLGDMPGSPTGGPAPSHTIEFDVTVNNPSPNDSTISNTATAGASNIPGTTSDYADHTVSSAPGLTVDKTADPAEGGPIEPGATITYTLVVANDPLANQTATNVELTDPTPAGTTYLEGSATFDDGIVGPVAVPDNDSAPLNPFEDGHSLGDMAPGDTYRLTFQVVVETPLDNGTTITNTATLNSDQGSATGDATHTVASQPALTLVKSASPAEGGPVTPGTRITYSMVVSNDAASNEVADQIVLTDPTPAGTTYAGGSAAIDGSAIPGDQNPLAEGLDLPDLAPGASTTVTYDVVVNSPLAGGTVIANLATLTADNHPDLSDDATHTVDSAAVMKVEVTASPAAGSEVKSGQTIVYTVKVSSDPASTETLTGVNATHTAPQGSTASPGSIGTAPESLNAPVTGSQTSAGADLVAILVEDPSLTDPEIVNLNNSLWWELANGASLTQALAKHPNVLENMLPVNVEGKTLGPPMWLWAGSPAELEALVRANPSISQVVDVVLEHYYPVRMYVEQATVEYQIDLGMTPTISPELAAWQKGVEFDRSDAPALRATLEESFPSETLPPLNPEPLSSASLQSAALPLGNIEPGQSAFATFEVTLGRSSTGQLTNTITVSAANHPTVAATTTHLGPDPAGDDDGGGDGGGRAFGPGGGGGTTTTATGPTFTGADSLAFTGLDLARLVLLAMSLLLGGLVLLTRGQVLQSRAIIITSAHQPAYEPPSGRYAPRTWFFLPTRD